MNAYVIYSPIVDLNNQAKPFALLSVWLSQSARQFYLNVIVHVVIYIIS